MSVRAIFGGSALPSVLICFGCASAPRPAAQAAPVSSPRARASASMPPREQKIAVAPTAAEPALGPEPAAVGEPESAHASSLEVPQACVERDKLCLPPHEVVMELCRARHPDAPIVLLEKHSRWTRGYIRMKEVDSVNTLGGPSSETKLVFAEEVVILGHRSGNGGGMAVSGAGGYDVLRWDGTCATLGEEELVTWMPGLPQNAPISFKHLDPSIQEALLADKQIRAARQEQKRECRGASIGALGPDCERATKKLNDSIVAAVRSGIQLPIAKATE